MYAKILVPIDGSATAKRGLDEAIKIAKDQGSQMRLVHVVNEFILDQTYAPGIYFNSVIETLREAGKSILAEALASARQQGVVCDDVLVETIGGIAANLILEQASLWPADLIVMGTHGRRGVARLTLGSDAEHVIRAATVPVMLVRSLQRHKNTGQSTSAAVQAA
jgi:nucleotide-binding universal stress UspA family protein